LANLSTLRAAVAGKLGLTTTASGNEETLTDRWLNEGVVDVLLKTRCNVNVGTVSVTAGTSDYTLGTAILEVMDMTYQSVSQSTSSSLERTTPAEILRLRQAGALSSPAQMYALNGNDLLMLWPTPSSADTITLYYVPRPTAMSATGNDPSSETYGGIPSEYHKAIEYYALWQGADYDDDASSKVGADYRRLYLELIAEFKRAARKKGGRSLGKAVVGRRPRLPHDNSQDTGAW
jgi:hypothetical protein